MAKNNDARINLCFNLDEPGQKMVYTFLKGIAREKTSVVTEIVLRDMFKEKQESLDTVSNKIDVLSDKVAKTAHQLELLVQSLNNGASLTSLEPRKENETPVIEREEAVRQDDADISDEAFADMMALLY